MTDKGVSIRGKLSPSYVPISGIELAAITGLCFNGMGLHTCKSVLPNDDFVIREDLPYYTQTLKGQNSYCLECCSTNPKQMDRWQLECQVDFLTAITTNLYAYEFRFGRMETLSDQEVITCPLKRSACTYDGNKITNCSSSDATYLWSYTLDIQVVEHNDNFGYWKGVSSCSAVTDERTVAMSSGDKFVEVININFGPQSFTPSKPYNMLFLLFTAIVLFYPTIRFCRIARCLICNRRLILVPWPLKRCAMCLFVNADFPDPYVLEALEAKGRRIIDGDISVPSPWYRVWMKAIGTAFHYICRKNKKNTLATREISVLPKIEEGENEEETKSSRSGISGSNSVKSKEHSESLQSSPSSPFKNGPAGTRSRTNSFSSHNNTHTPVSARSKSSPSKSGPPVSPLSMGSPGKSLLFSVIDRLTNDAATDTSQVHVTTGTHDNGDNMSMSALSVDSCITIRSEPIPSRPSFLLGSIFNRNTKEEKYVNPHILSHKFSKSMIFKAINEDGRKTILTDEQKEAAKKVMKHKRRASLPK